MMTDITIARGRPADYGCEDGNISSAAVAGVHARACLLIAGELHITS